jgi:hypothetical protein
MLGQQIDRMGRAAIGTATISTFTAADTRKTARVAYNQDTSRANWATTYASGIAGQIAIYDALDSGIGAGANGCGNQFAFSASTGYSALAGVLADDYLLIDLQYPTCNQYLAVEANLVKGAGTVTECGGRTPVVDTIQRTYTLLVEGNKNGATLNGIGDGEDTPGQSTLSDDATQGTTNFPYLAAPL